MIFSQSFALFTCGLDTHHKNGTQVFDIDIFSGLILKCVSRDASIWQLNGLKRDFQTVLLPPVPSGFEEQLDHWSKHVINNHCLMSSTF